MLSTRLHKFFTASAAKTSKSPAIFWFSLSVTFAAIYGILGLQQAFSAEYVVQDDARQHVFWMQRFLDPQLFPDDAIANYFQSVAPGGYAALYQLMAAVGINPLLLHKLLPSVLGLITTTYCFGVCMEFLAVPIAGFIGTLLLNQSLWMQDGLISATPKAFVYPLFMAFLYYFLKKKLLLTCIAIALVGLFYPQAAFICAGILILQLVEWEKGRPHLSHNRQDYLFCGICLTIALFVMLPYALTSSEFAPTITASEAKTFPEFLPGGRTRFFINDPWRFWLHGRSGIGLSSAVTPALMGAGFLLPLLLRDRSRFPLAKQVNGASLLPQLMLASLVMFFAAHALLFKLHLPTRYTQHSLRIVMAIAAGLSLTIILDAVWRWAIQKPNKKIYLASFLICFFPLLFFYPNWAMKNFPWTYYQVGAQPALYEFFQQQPKNILIASLSEEANNLPTFAQRSILVGREYAVPFHLGYYRKFRDRVLALIQAQYSPNLADAQQFTQKYGIDFWLLDRGAFTPEYFTQNRWLLQYQPAANEAIAQLEAKKKPAIASFIQRCSVFETGGLVVLKADCIK